MSNRFAVHSLRHTIRSSNRYLHSNEPSHSAKKTLALERILRRCIARRRRELSFCPTIKANRRFSILLLLFLSPCLLPGAAHSQCTAAAAGAAAPVAPVAPILNAQISAGDPHVTGTATAGNMVVICVNGSLTSSPTKVAYNGSFQAAMNVSLTAGQQVTAQQYDPMRVGAAVYSPISSAVKVGDTDTCVETLQSGKCQFRIQVDTSAAVGNGSQTSTNTTPNIMATLDYQFRPPQDVEGKNGLKALQARDPSNHTSIDNYPSWAAHLRIRTGYTQTFAASNVQPTPTNGGAAPSCPSNSKSPSSGNCMLAIPKPSFIAEIGGRFGGTKSLDGEGHYGEYGVSGRGSFQYLIPTNQIVQNNGASYIDLSSTDPHNAVGFYEIMGYAEITQHGQTLSNTKKAQNSSPLLVIEGGYQNNRALQQLMPANPQSSTRDRYVGRFSFNYEVSKATHSQVSFGVEYSGGINGGPHVVQLFIGGNLNPPKLFGKNGG